MAHAYVIDPTAQQVYVDRTALELFWLCPRKFYWARRYLHPKYAKLNLLPEFQKDGGPTFLQVLGVEPLANEHRVFGKLMHRMVEKGLEPNALPTAAALGSAVAKEVMADNETTVWSPQQGKEFVGLALGLAHQLVNHILPHLLAEHTVVAVEQELLIPLPPIDWMGIRLQLVIRVKPDLILKHKADGQYVYFEWKTTSFTGHDQLGAFEINPQLQLGLLATEIKYGHADWAQVGLFYKGQTRNGQRTSPFCYGYVCADGRLSTAYIKGWHKTPVVDLLQQNEETIDWWVAKMPEEQEQGLFWVTPPIFPNNFQRDAILTDLPRHILPRMVTTEISDYPRSLVNCTGAFGKTCDYFGACYQSQQDIVYAGRVPHHDPQPVVLYDAKGTPYDYAV